ncbi:MAG: hypothetical protein M3Q46_10735 [Verrucomicrobiota bacterium]|nr:hypothetical protein [Verrucomicrobiota bacterium]
MRTTTIDYDQRMKKFLKRLEKDEMPPLETINWASSYNGNVFGWILQTGALEFFDIHTVARLREVDAVVRTGLAILSHYERLSDELIAPISGTRVASTIRRPGNFDPSMRFTRRVGTTARVFCTRWAMLASASRPSSGWNKTKGADPQIEFELASELATSSLPLTRSSTSRLTNSNLC